MAVSLSQALLRALRGALVSIIKGGRKRTGSLPVRRIDYQHSMIEEGKQHEKEYGND